MTIAGFSREAKEGQSWYPNTLQVSAYIIFGIVPLAEETHVSNLNSKGGEIDSPLAGGSAVPPYTGVDVRRRRIIGC